MTWGKSLNPGTGQDPRQREIRLYDKETNRLSIIDVGIFVATIDFRAGLFGSAV
ncbi:hypothetical protein ROBYS_39920 [Roseobacter sp. OBYS 0001]|nr:hypothetical protein ROBYS_39920 [Roseobacter sp. OBYS 0001]